MAHFCQCENAFDILVNAIRIGKLFFPLNLTSYEITMRCHHLCTIKFKWKFKQKEINNVAKKLCVFFSLKVSSFNDPFYIGSLATKVGSHWSFMTVLLNFYWNNAHTQRKHREWRKCFQINLMDLSCLVFFFITILFSFTLFCRSYSVHVCMFLFSLSRFLFA